MMKLVQIFMDIVAVAMLTFLGWGIIKDELLEIVDTISDIKKHKRREETNSKLFDLIQSILFVIAYLLFFTLLYVVVVGMIDVMFSYDAMLNSGT